MELSLRVIKSVHKNPCLWNPHIPEYKCHRSRTEAWEEVVDICGFSEVREARAFWKKLRDGHRQAISKVNKRDDSRKWKYEDDMKFLRPFMVSRQSTTSVKGQPFEDTSNFYEDDDDDDDIDAYGEIDDAVDIKTELKNTVDDKKMVANKKRRLSNTQSEEKLVRFEVVDPLDKSSDSNIPVNSALAKFFSSMCETTNALPERLQVKVQRKVFNAVMEAQEEYLAFQESADMD